MEKLGLLYKGTLENKIKDYLKDSASMLIVRYSKLSSPDISALRQLLKGSSATLFVSKNTVIRRALKESGFNNITNYIDGNCGLVFTKEEPVNTCKVLYNFSREHQQLKIEGGLLGDKVLEKTDIEALSRLPSKEVLRAQVVMTLKSPISGFVMVLNQVLKKFVYCLEQVKNRKQSEDKPSAETDKK